MGAVSLERVSRRFGSHVAVDDLSLTVQNGEFLVLLGPSGCGKTTSLRMLAGLEQPTSGLIRIDNQIVNDIPSGRRDIGMVFQSYALYPRT
jgi:multiple sugar transport system ATP-binding protein